MRRIRRFWDWVHSQFRRSSDGRESVASNGTWATLQQTANVGAQALLSFLLVIVLPTEDFGVYSYAIVMASLGINFMTAGLSGLAIKVLVNAGDGAARLVTSILLIREAMAAIGYLVLALLSFTSGSSVAVAATLVAALALFARAADAPEYWFKAELRTRVPASIRIIVTVVVFIVRLAGIMLGAGLFFYLATYLLEAVAGSAWILIRYRRLRRTKAFARHEVAVSRGLLRKSFPLLISGVASQINLKGDVIVIQMVLGSSAVAIYSAAARLAEISYFLPTVFMNATLPGLVELHDKHGADSEYFRRVMQRSYDRAFWMGVVVAVATGVVGTAIILLFFDDEYEDSVLLLWIGLAVCPLMFMSAVYSKWILTVDLLWASTARNVIGAVANIGLNFALLPALGLAGASIATLVSYSLAAYFSCFFGRRTRIAGVQMTLAIAAPARMLFRRPKL
jgi:O-antigen/teichoic acid export membrane protein